MADDAKAAAAPTKDKEEASAPASTTAEGKQPETTAAESDDEHDGEQAEGGASAGAAETGTSTASKKKRKNKKKKSAAAAAEAVSADDSGDAESAIKSSLAKLPPSQLAELLKFNPAVQQELARSQAAGEGSSASGAAGGQEAALDALKRLSLADILTGLAASGKNAKDMASYKFWQTQPVPRFGEDEEPGKKVSEGPIQQLTVDDVPKQPPPLVDGFEWDTIDLTDDSQLQEVYSLLEGHFVEDTEAMFRFCYSKAILKWAMMSPGWIKEWHIGVRASQSRKLVAFVSAIPLELRIRDKILHASEVNFLVIHKKLRSKRLAPILIKEITRLCNLRGVWQALYTAGVVLPKPVSTSRYYHRSLDWQKLYDIGFSPLPKNSKPEFQVRKYKLPDHTHIKGLREMRVGDVDAVQSLLTRYLARYDMAMEFSKAEVEHWMLDKKLPGDEQVVYSYVVEDANKKITDFFSFYSLASSVINNPKHRLLRAAYLFYYATETGLTEPLDKAALKVRLNELMLDTLILAKKNKFDVMNALSIMDNALFLEQQKYGPGDGQLHYYLFNYRANPITGGVDRRNQLDEESLSGIGFVMM